jgi:hypothetical protein
MPTPLTHFAWGRLVPDETPSDVIFVLVPRAGEVVALEAYERIVRKALADSEDEGQMADRLKAAGVAGEQAAAAATVYNSRLPEMRAHLLEATAQVFFFCHNGDARYAMLHS